MSKINNWEKQKAVGNMAEDVIKFLINSTPNWKCRKYGIENHIGELKKSLRNNQNEISRKIRSMPDFVAINTETNDVLLIDVKYRSFIDRRLEVDGNTERRTALYGFGYGQMKDYLEFWKNTKLIVIHPREPYFFVIDLKDVEWHKHFHSRTKNNEKLYEQWNFLKIEKPIQELFPSLSEDTIKKAIDMIYNKK